MASTADQFGIADSQGFAQKFPALSAKLATITAAKTGLDAGDPKNVVTALHSNIFKTEAMKAASATDQAAIDRVFNPPEISSEGDQTQQTNAAFDAKEQNIRDVSQAKGALFRQSQEANDKLAELSSFDQAEYRNAQLKKLNPTKDIDQRMLDLRLQAFAADALLESDPEIMALPPALQARAKASKLAVFSNAISTLGQIRQTRLATANDQIDQEISGKTKQINTASARVQSLDRQIKYLTDTGADNDTIASLRLDRLKEMERLTKARGKAGGMSTQKEFVYQALQEEYRATHGQPATGADADSLRSQAEAIANSPEELAKVGTTVAVPGTETQSLNLPWWRRIAPSTFVGGGLLPNEVEVQTQTPQSYLQARGYGIPLSASEVVKMRKDRADLTKAEKAAAE